MKRIVLESAQKAIDKGVDVSDKTWLTIEKGKAVSLDWESYVSDITRMKPTPAFDNLELRVRKMIYLEQKIQIASILRIMVCHIVM